MLRKKSLCEYHMKHPASSRQQIADYIQKVHKVDISLATISDILNGKEKWLNQLSENSQKTRQRATAFESLDKALLIWFTNMRERRATMTDDILIQKAQELGR